MPQAIAAIVAYAIPATAATAVTVAGVAVSYAAIIGYGAVLLGSLALSSYQKRKAERAANAQHDSAQQDRLANVVTTIGSRELVMGPTRKGGTVFFRTSTGAFKERFVMCIAMAANEIDSYQQIYFNDTAISLDGSGNVLTAPWGRSSTGSATENLIGNVTVLGHTPVVGQISVSRTVTSEGVITTEEVAYSLAGTTLTISGYDANWTYTAAYQYSDFQSVAMVRTYTGASGQAADVHMTQLFPDLWTAAHRADGVAYIVCEFVYEETAFPNGIPLVTASIRGAKIYDPRSGLTVYTENPALMMRHVLLHPQFGKRTSITAAEDARIIAAANACDAGFSYDGVNTPALYRAGIVVPFGAPARDVLDDLAQAMGGQWAYAAGEIYMKAGVYQAPVMSLTDADLAVVQRSNDGSTSQSPITISPHKPRNEKINVIAPRIWNQANNFVLSPIYPFKVSSYITADGAELVQEVTMPAVFYDYQAYHIAGIMLRDNRDPLTVTLPFKLRAYPIELFDGVTLTLSRYGWSSKEFQVLGRQFMADGTVVLTLKETISTIFTWGGGFAPGGLASNTNLPAPWLIQPPQIIYITSADNDLIVQSDGTIITGVRVTWSALSDASVTQVEVQYLVPPSTIWKSVVVPATEQQAILVGVPDGSIVIVRARSKSSLATSDWSAQRSHLVVGKLAPPPNITELSIAGSVLSWTLANPPRDLAGFVFRFQYGNNRDWNSATPMHTGILTQSPYDLVTRPGGVVTIMGKAIDTTGNVSVSTANIVMNLGDPNIANIVEQWDFDALGWPYVAAESSGWTIVSGDPSADSLDSFYGTDDQSLYGGDTDSFYGPSAYGQMVYVSSEISVSSALAGSIMTLEATTQGTDLRIEYRLAGPGSFYGTDGDSFYGDDADPLYGAPGGWLPWPGQIVVTRDVYQFRITIGAGEVRGILSGLVVTIDAPDMEETIADLAIGSGGTTIPYTKPFTAIKVVQATLQANGSGAETVEINKTVPLSPVIRAFNSGHTAVAGATADIVIKGY